MTNLTITVDEEVLRQARIRALQQETSVSVVLREFLESYVGRAAAQAGASDRLLEFSERLEAGSGGRTWTRDDLHDRAALRDG